MNVEKTELHMLRGSQHAVVQSVHGGRVSTGETAGRPHSVYKYLWVYFYTTDHAARVCEFVRAEINSFSCSPSATAAHVVRVDFPR